MAAVTGLRAERGDRVAVEIDGRPWRVLPVGAVAAAGLRVGLELDRPRLRTLRRELRRLEAVDVAARALGRRDHSRDSLERKLAHARVAPAARDEALATLARAGAVDDPRFAHARAAALAERGLGDAAIGFDLERQGVEAELVADAVAALEPEPERALRLVATRGATPATARYLARRGFREDTLESVLGEVIADAT